jgi:hypothetical protein
MKTIIEDVVTRFIFANNNGGIKEVNNINRIFVDDFLLPVKEIWLYQKLKDKITSKIKKPNTQLITKIISELMQYDSFQCQPYYAQKDSKSIVRQNYEIFAGDLIIDRLPVLLQYCTWEQYCVNENYYRDKINLYCFIHDKNIKQAYIVFFISNHRNELKNIENYPENNYVVKEYTLYDAEYCEKLIANKIRKIEECRDCKYEELPLCTKEERGLTNVAFAYYSNKSDNESGKATRVFSKLEDAKDYMEYMNCGKIVARSGINVNCFSCKSMNVCKQYRDIIINVRRGKQ